jgi:hypothetical protein
MNQAVEERLEELRLASQSHVDQLQIELAPFLADNYVQFHEKKYRYTWKGVKTRIGINDKFRAFRVEGLRYADTPSSKVMRARRDYLKDFIDDGEVYPFLLFANKSLVPWSNIELIRDYRYDYLLIYGLNKEEDISFNIIEFPCTVRYGEDDDILPESDRSLGLYFDEDGHLTMSDDIRYRLEIVDDSIYGELQLISEEKPYIEFHMSGNFVVQPTSIIVFKDGVVDPNGTAQLRTRGWNIFYNPFPEEFASLKYAIFYNTKVSESPSYVYTICIDQEGNTESLKNNLRLGVNYLTKLFKLSTFDFQYSKDKTYEENMNDALKYIMNYNANLMDKVYQTETDIYIEHHTGAELLARSAKTGYLRISRKRAGKFDRYLSLMYVNGYQYAYTDRITYKNNMIEIPIIDIKAKDRIEFIFDGGYDNDVSSIVVEKGVPVYIGKNLGSCQLFSNEKHNLVYDVFEIDPDGRTQFEVDFEYEDLGDGNYLITFDDEWYYGHRLSVASINQRQYCRFDKNTINPNTDGDYYFLLPTDFNFCHDKNHYNVILNGKGLSQQHFTVTSPNRNRPFDKQYLYITAKMGPDDVLDVFYLPTYMVESLYVDDLSTSGDIVVDCSEIDVPLSTDNYFVYVDGIKVHPDDIINISRNKIRITTPYQSLHNVRLVNYNRSVQELEDAFKNTTDDEWSRYIDSLERYNLNKLIGNISDVTPSIDSMDEIDYDYELSTIVSDIIFDFYMKRAGLDLTDGTFIYDFEPDAVKLTQDDNGVVSLSTTDSTLYDKMYKYYYNQTKADYDELTDVAKSPVDDDA